MELPGWTSGSEISPRPARGPEAMKRMSLAILCRLMATVSARRCLDQGIQRRLCLEVVAGLADFYSRRLDT